MMKMMLNPACCALSTLLLGLTALGHAADAGQAPPLVPDGPGIWKVTLGAPEPFTPVYFRSHPPATEGLNALPEATPPFAAEDIRFSASARGCVVELPLANDEHLYGLGARQPALEITGRRINVQVTDNPDLPDGSGHGPVPFYVSTKGYGVFVDTLRYARFYCGNLARADGAGTAGPGDGAPPPDSTAELYKPRTPNEKSVVVDVPAAQGVDVYVFAGPTLLDAVRRYNLFSGGGCLPPMWGLGIYFRGYGKFGASDILALAHSFRERHIPCDVFGLEPGWHSQAYSCSFAWSPERWPDPAGFLAEMRGMNYQLNLWEHAFVHPTAPFHDAIRPYSGDYRVWDGLVPDFTLDGARRIFGDYHEAEFVRNGVTGFKLDECDNQPQHDKPWSFPELARFPSGLDGEQMHGLFGLAYQRTLFDVFKRNNIRTYGKVRATHALAAPMPFVLYSDGYEHRSYVRGILNSGFCGTLWQPEVRVAGSVLELYRRIETMIFSPQAVIDDWFMPHPSWHQISELKNKAGILMPERDEVEAKVRELFQLRMRLIPYFYSAFADYRARGTPPFRALVTDYPDDANTYGVDDEYLAGESLLVAPLFGDDTSRKVYLPAGAWYCFWTHARYEGGREHKIEMPPERIPLFVKEGALLPLADPVEYVTPETKFALTVLAFGAPCRPFTLCEDDGVSWDFEQGAQNRVTLAWSPETGGTVAREGNYAGERYVVNTWEVVSP